MVLTSVRALAGSIPPTAMPPAGRLRAVRAGGRLPALPARGASTDLAAAVGTDAHGAVACRHVLDLDLRRKRAILALGRCLDKSPPASYRTNTLPPNDVL